MGSTFGKNVTMTIFGQSHSPALGMTLEGIPAGSRIDEEELRAFLTRRAPGQNDYSTPRKEADIPEFVSGIVGGITCGTPITALIRNTDTHSGDYELLKRVPRPGHADYTAEVRYNGYQDYAGGGHFSGRMTAPLCVAGGICKQLLEKEGITIISRIYSVKDIKDEGELQNSTADKLFPVVDDSKGQEMIQCILNAAKQGDSVGGIVECAILGLPAGIGDPMFDGMENRIANACFGIPAVKGIEFGAGFDAARMFGSENNDEYCIRDGRIQTIGNNAGGILGGITNGMPVTFKVALKPTPSIRKEQKSVDLSTMEETTLVVPGRHDPCIVPRAVPCVEAAAALAVYDAYISSKM